MKQHLKKPPFLCRRGYHIWRFLYMSNVRLVTAGAHSEMMCELTEGCRKCGITRTRHFAKVPKRVKA